MSIEEKRVLVNILTKGEILWYAEVDDFELQRTDAPPRQVSGVLRAVFSPDDSLVVTVGDDHTRIWNATTGKQICDYLGNRREVNDKSIRAFLATSLKYASPAKL